MRLFVDLATDRIVRVAPTPNPNETTTVNGKWVFEIPEGADVTVEAPYTLAGIELDCLAELLIRYPMYDNIIGSWFREDTDMDVINQTAGSGALPGMPLRYRMGRQSTAINPGVAPNCLEIPAVNTRSTTNQPGQLVLGPIDLANPQPGFPGIPLGTDEVMLWWKVAEFSTTADVTTPAGGWTPANTNTPSLKQIRELPSHTPSGFRAYVTNDNGTTWYEAFYLEPIDLVNNGTQFKVCFVNEGDDPVHLLGFCALFPDHWTP
jgi:hypothetical protein